MDEKTKKRIITVVGCATIIGIPFVYLYAKKTAAAGGGVVSPGGEPSEEIPSEGGGSGGGTPPPSIKGDANLTHLTATPSSGGIGDVIAVNLCVDGATEILLEYGDGFNKTFTAGGAQCFDATHQYSTAGSFTITATAKNSMTAGVTISGGGGAPPSTTKVTKLTATPTVITGQPATIDICVDGSGQIKINYGDGNQKYITASGAQCLIDHRTYTVAAAYTVTASVGTSSKSTTIQVVNPTVPPGGGGGTVIGMMGGAQQGQGQPTPACSLSFIVKNFTTRQPLAGYLVSVETTHVPPISLTTDPHGQVTVNNLPCGDKYTIKLIDPRFAVTQTGMFQLSDGWLSEPVHTFPPFEMLGRLK